MDRYLGGEEIDQAVLIEDLEQRGRPRLVLPGHPGLQRDRRRHPGVARGRDQRLPVAARAHRCPRCSRPHGVPRTGLACDPSGPLLAEVVKTTSDPYVGRVSLVRVFSGTIRPDTTVHVSGHFTSFFGDENARRPRRGRADRHAVVPARQGAATGVPTVVAGDLCAIGRLTRAETGDTLSDKAEPLLLKPWTMPEPLLPIAVQAHAKTDEDKLVVGLQRLAAEDPTLRIEQNPETHQIVLWCMGEAHSDVVLDALANRYGVTVDTVELRVPLRETFGGKAKGHGRHVKQSGGHGQYAVCDIEVEPLPEGTEFEFVDKVVGGAVPRQFIPSVEKGVRAQMEKGVARRLSDGQHPGHAARRQGAQRRLVGHGVPDGRRAGAARGRRRDEGEPAGAGGPGLGAGAGRAGRRGDERPVRPARAAARHGQGRRRPHAGEGRGAAGGDHPLRHRPAVALARRRVVHAAVLPLRTDARLGGSRR